MVKGVAYISMYQAASIIIPFTIEHDLFEKINFILFYQMHVPINSFQHRKPKWYQYEKNLLQLCNHDFYIHHQESYLLAR